MYVFYLKRLLTDEPIERLKIFFSGEKCFEEFILIWELWNRHFPFPFFWKCCLLFGCHFLFPPFAAVSHQENVTDWEFYA
jgi:hypothetical protein